MVKENESIKNKLAKFEEIIEWFDGDNIDIETATAKYEEGAKLADDIKKQLENAKNSIEILKQKFDD